MKSPLHILILEDDPLDVTLILSTLAAGGIECTTTCVQNREEFVVALERDDLDLILSDYSLPAFDGWSALKLARAARPGVPVILVSGTLGEEQAIESLQSGATDYVLKEGLVRLVPAVRRAMQEVEERVERRRLEAQFIEAQKMEVVGQLAGGIAHDFNNVLGVIIGYSELIVEDLGPEHHLQKYIEEIRHAADRACGLTRQLLVFSRKQTIQAEVLDLNEVVESMHKMLSRLIDENIEMVLVYGEQIGRVEADAGYIWQVLMNLVVNARDAMPEGGKLTIETGKITLNESDGKLNNGVPAGDYVMLNVSDTGTGLTSEVKSRMFEAFFTTKASGKGTGLGLSTCQTIVQQCGGHIRVDSEISKGTTFRIYFPAVKQQVKAKVAAIPVGSSHRGTETLLIVEDEPSLRHLTRGGLEALGYEVLTAPNGQDALGIVREHKGAPISLVISDVMMPRMGGKVMAEWLKTMHPDLKVLFVSGYMDTTFSQQGILDPGVAYLPKPYTLTRLAAKVREMLDR